MRTSVTVRTPNLFRTACVHISDQSCTCVLSSGRTNVLNTVVERAKHISLVSIHLFHVLSLLPFV